MKNVANHINIESEAMFLGINNKHIHASNADRKIREAYLTFQKEVEEDLDYDLFDDGYYDV